MKNHDALLDHPEFADIDRHFAKFIARFGGDELPVVAAALLSRSIRQGHICLDLRGSSPPLDVLPHGFRWPNPDTWRAALGESSAVSDADAAAPLVLDKTDRLYFRRYWNYEQALAAAFLERSSNGGSARTESSDDAQQLAIETALTRKLTIISGGPGTGKTTTVLRILARLLSAPDGDTLRIALAAPTGKAAARLEETLRNGSPELDASIRARLPQTASTLHRLLGFKDGSVYFRHNANNPLAVDVLVIDEASMVALPLMAKVFDALLADARVILLGDRDQLASVEPGAVLGDIAEAASAPGSPLAGSLVMLKKNYRFGNESGIFQMCRAVREGDAAQALTILRNGNCADLGGDAVPSAAKLVEKLREPVLAGFSAYLRESDPAAALAAFNQFRVLCAPRQGPFGVEELNRQVEHILRQANLIKNPSQLYAGAPVLITQNDYALRLFNGDIGILLPDSNARASGDADASQLWAWFIGEKNELRRIPPARLPAHEPAFAMTVHKSQGSEFERVLFILPDRDSPILTRELIYTGLTRARKRVDLWFNETVFQQAITRRTQRTSGLRDALSTAAKSLRTDRDET